VFFFFLCAVWNSTAFGTVGTAMVELDNDGDVVYKAFDSIFVVMISSRPDIVMLEATASSVQYHDIMYIKPLHRVLEFPKLCQITNQYRNGLVFPIQYRSDSLF